MNTKNGASVLEEFASLCLPSAGQHGDTPVTGPLVSQFHLTANRISPMDWVYIRCGYISQCTLFYVLSVLLLKQF